MPSSNKLNMQSGRWADPFGRPSGKSLVHVSSAVISLETSWFELPTGVGSFYIIEVSYPAGPIEISPLAIVEYDRVPSQDLLESVGLMTLEPGTICAALRSTGIGKRDVAYIAAPVGYALKRIGLRVAPGMSPRLADEITISRLINSPTGREILVNLSVDVEALPHRAPRDHVDRLIYGRFDGGEFGIPAQLALFSALAVPATFYLECGQAALYGNETIDAVGKSILDAGFDLQLHLHSELLAEAQCWPWNQTYPPALEYLDRDQTLRAYGYAAERYHAIAGRTADVFRAGAFQFSPATVSVAGQFGIKAHSNFRADQPQNNTYTFKGKPAFSPFRWVTGLYELPITLSLDPLSRPVEEYWKRIIYQVQVNGTWLVNLVIHSWSFLSRDEEGYQVYGDPALAENLRKIIEWAPEGVRFVQISDVVKSLCNHEVGVHAIMDPGDLVRQILPRNGI
jgi:hypothetical protein